MDTENTVDAETQHMQKSPSRTGSSVQRRGMCTVQGSVSLSWLAACSVSSPASLESPQEVSDADLAESKTDGWSKEPTNSSKNLRYPRKKRKGGRNQNTLENYLCIIQDFAFSSAACQLWEEWPFPLVGPSARDGDCEPGGSTPVPKWFQVPTTNTPLVDLAELFPGCLKLSHPFHDALLSRKGQFHSRMTRTSLLSACRSRTGFVKVESLDSNHG
ncbi:uncharacterized protein BJX67DRAFT_56331 [Aspergillus lucknowensis]|uniref:Uncharacterized protein n=1 Tax=Aspergillus lucknowensis TaxID=176173 RepID=A0ABR4LV21_9EURO